MWWGVGWGVVMCLKEKSVSLSLYHLFQRCRKKVRKKRIKAVFWTLEGTLSQGPRIPGGRQNACLCLKGPFVALCFFSPFYFLSQRVSYLWAACCFSTRGWPGRFQRGSEGQVPGWPPGACDLVQCHPCLGPGPSSVKWGVSLDSPCSLPLNSGPT